MQKCIFKFYVKTKDPFSIFAITWIFICNIWMLSTFHFSEKWKTKSTPVNRSQFKINVDLLSKKKNILKNIVTKIPSPDHEVAQGANSMGCIITLPARVNKSWVSVLVKIRPTTSSTISTLPSPLFLLAADKDAFLRRCA